MPALIDLYNRALGWCRTAAMVAPDEDTVSGRACRRYYATSRDTVLRAYPWNCAAGRDALAEVTPAPAFEFDHRYRLPDDCLAVRQLWDDPAADYVVEGRDILTNLSAPLRLKFTRTIAPDAMDALLFGAVAAQLAYDMAPHLTESTTLTDALRARAEQALRTARAVDASEGVPVEVPAVYGWAEVRL